MNIVNKLKFSSDSDLFALERDNGVEAIILIYIKLLMERTYTLQSKKKQLIFCI